MEPQPLQEGPDGAPQTQARRLSLSRPGHPGTRDRCTQQAGETGTREEEPTTPAPVLYHPWQTLHPKLAESPKRGFETDESLGFDCYTALDPLNYQTGGLRTLRVTREAIESAQDFIQEARRNKSTE